MLPSDKALLWIGTPESVYILLALLPRFFKNKMSRKK